MLPKLNKHSISDSFKIQPEQQNDLATLTWHFKQSATAITSNDIILQRKNLFIFFQEQKTSHNKVHTSIKNLHHKRQIGF